MVSLQLKDIAFVELVVDVLDQALAILGDNDVIGRQQGV